MPSIVDPEFAKDLRRAGESALRSRAFSAQVEAELSMMYGVAEEGLRKEGLLGPIPAHGPMEEKL